MHIPIQICEEHFHIHDVKEFWKNKGLQSWILLLKATKMEKNVREFQNIWKLPFCSYKELQNSLSEEHKHMQLCLAFHLTMFIPFIWTGVLRQMGASCIKLKSLKNWTVRFWEKVRSRWQENGTDSFNYEVQSSWTVTSCFWEEIINGQPEARKCIGQTQNREGRMSQSTWLSRLGSNTIIWWMVCRGSVNRLTKPLFHFPSCLAKFYP